MNRHIDTVSRVAKATTKNFMVRCGVVGAARMFGRTGAAMPILRYHGVTPPTSYCTEAISVSPALFEKHLAYLAAHYRVLSLDDVVDCIKAGSPFPDRAACITFDDGYLDNYVYALPLLRKYRLTATFYVVAGPIARGERFWVGWLQDIVTRTLDLTSLYRAFELPGPPPTILDQNARQSLITHVLGLANRGNLAERDEVMARVEKVLGGKVPPNNNFMLEPKHLIEMAHHGMTIGSHTVSHPILASLPQREVTDELASAKRLLEEILDRPIVHLAYPNGPGVARNFTAETMRLAEEAGYRSAATSRRGVVSAGSNLFALERQGINQRLEQSRFAFKLEEHRFSPLLSSG